MYTVKISLISSNVEAKKDFIKKLRSASADPQETISMMNFFTLPMIVNQERIKVAIYDQIGHEQFGLPETELETSDALIVLISKEGLQHDLCFLSGVQEAGKHFYIIKPIAVNLQGTGIEDNPYCVRMMNYFYDGRASLSIVESLAGVVLQRKQVAIVPAFTAACAAPPVLPPVSVRALALNPVLPVVPIAAQPPRSSLAQRLWDRVFPPPSFEEQARKEAQRRAAEAQARQAAGRKPAPPVIFVTQNSQEGNPYISNDEL